MFPNYPPMNPYPYSNYGYPYPYAFPPATAYPYAPTPHPLSPPQTPPHTPPLTAAPQSFSMVQALGEDSLGAPAYPRAAPNASQVPFSQEFYFPQVPVPFMNPQFFHQQVQQVQQPGVLPVHLHHTHPQPQQQVNELEAAMDGLTLSNSHPPGHYPPQQQPAPTHAPARTANFSSSPVSVSTNTPRGATGEAPGPHTKPKSTPDPHGEKKESSGHSPKAHGSRSKNSKRGVVASDVDGTNGNS
eukprot:c11220_g1_i2.p1 GENE.c11220_g1_i2~~c11220_g1_i2.p1  ORF type:complete len:243 (+),score=14.69 c11220_g1_i2:481-1209(+)